MDAKLTNKLIIRNYTDLDDHSVILRVGRVIQDGKISETKSQGKQYCFITTFTDCEIICNKRNETYTFYVIRKED